MSNQSFSSDFGTTGIIDIPNSRMLNDGILNLTYSSQKLANIANITYQATPWLQTTFRYTIFNPNNPVRNSTQFDGLNDRSYALKMRLFEENKTMPEISIGIQDFIGTGALGAEYLVASKRINSFDFSLGMGWGRFSERDSLKNPIGIFSDKYKIRRKVDTSRGGKSRLDSFFSGSHVGLFGGVTYTIPNSKIRLLAEYNSDAYEREIRLKTIEKSSPISFGIELMDFYGADLKFSYQQGNEFAFSLASNLETKIIQPRFKDKLFYSSYDWSDQIDTPESLNIDSWYDRLFYDLDQSGIILRKASLNTQENSVMLEVTNFRYNLTSDAINRVLTLGQVHLPQKINNINIIINENRFKTITVLYQRKNNLNGNPDFSDTNITLLQPRTIENYTNFTKLPISLRFNANLSSKFQIFDPDKPLKNQVFLKLTSILSLSDNLSINGSYAINIDHNFDLNRDPNSRLEHVRTDVNKYLVYGSSGIESLYLEYFFNPRRNIYFRSYGGILEMMYSGIGSEFLYQPFKSRLAFGATINRLRKRDFKRDFSLLDYETTTAFLSLFYASPFYNYDFAVHIGKYLAKDKGFTIEARRTFDNGFSVGAFATFTDVSAEEFGEGSYDKGLFFRIPFDSLLQRNTKTALLTRVRSLTRDGGQKLDDFTGRLWFDLRNVRYDALMNTRDRMLPR